MARVRGGGGAADDIAKALLKAIQQLRGPAQTIAVSRIPQGVRRGRAAVRNVVSAAPVEPKPNSLLQRGGRALPDEAAKLEKKGRQAAARARKENVANARRAKFIREERRQVGRARRTVRSIEKSEQVASGQLPRKGGRRPTKNERREAADVAAQKAARARAAFAKYERPKTVTQKIREGRGGKK